MKSAPLGLAGHVLASADAKVQGVLAGRLDPLFAAEPVRLGLDGRPRREHPFDRRGVGALEGEAVVDDGAGGGLGHFLFSFSGWCRFGGEVVPEAVEATLPSPAPLGDPVLDGVEALHVEPTGADPADLLGTDDPRGLEDMQVLQDRGQRHRHGRRQLADGGRSAVEELDDAAPGRVGERMEHRLLGLQLLKHALKYLDRRRNVKRTDHRKAMTATGSVTRRSAVRVDYRSRTRRSPRSTSCISDCGVVPILSVRSVLFTVTSAVMFTTESRGSPVAEAGRNVFPGMVASAVFEVMTAASTVARRLAL